MTNDVMRDGSALPVSDGVATAPTDVGIVHVCAKKNCAICVWNEGYRWGGLSPQTFISLWKKGER